MFGKSQGQKNFERCAVKEVASTGTYTARLDCAVTGEEGLEVYYGNEGSGVMKKLAEAAGSTICGGCIFASMAPDEYELVRARQAEAQAVRLEAEHRLDLLQRQIEEGTYGQGQIE
jgi:hypothetical protein